MTAVVFTCWMCARHLGRDATRYGLDTPDCTEVICGPCSRGRAQGHITRLGDRAKAARVLGVGDEQGGRR